MLFFTVVIIVMVFVIVIHVCIILVVSKDLQPLNAVQTHWGGVVGYAEV